MCGGARVAGPCSCFSVRTGIEESWGYGDCLGPAQAVVILSVSSTVSVKSVQKP